MRKSIIFILILMTVMLFAGCATNSAEPVQEELPAVEGTASEAPQTTGMDAMQAFTIGTDYLNQDDYENAEKYLSLAVQLDKEFIDAWDNLGIAYRLQGKYDEAEQAHLQSIYLNEDNYFPFMNLALVYLETNRADASASVYSDMIDRFPDNPEGYYGLGHVFVLVGMYENAIPYLNKATSLYYDNGSEYIIDSLYELAVCYYYLEDYEKAGNFCVFITSNFGQYDRVMNLYAKVVAARKASGQD